MKAHLTLREVAHELGCDVTAPARPLRSALAWCRRAGLGPVLWKRDAHTWMVPTGAFLGSSEPWHSATTAEGVMNHTLLVVSPADLQPGDWLLELDIVAEAVTFNAKANRYEVKCSETLTWALLPQLLVEVARPYRTQAVEAA